jgi:hypothetical protein
VRWDLQYLNAGRVERRVEGRAEFGVAIPDEEPEPDGALADVHQQVAGDLRDPVCGWVGGDPGQVHPATLDYHDEQHVEPA